MWFKLMGIEQQLNIRQVEDVCKSVSILAGLPLCIADVVVFTKCGAQKYRS